MKLLGYKYSDPEKVRITSWSSSANHEYILWYTRKRNIFNWLEILFCLSKNQCVYAYIEIDTVGIKISYSGEYINWGFGKPRNPIKYEYLIRFDDAL